jgi:hypothetical protein
VAAGRGRVASKRAGAWATAAASRRATPAWAPLSPAQHQDYNERTGLDHPQSASRRLRKRSSAMYRPRIPRLDTNGTRAGLPAQCDIAFALCRRPHAAGTPAPRTLACFELGLIGVLSLSARLLGR